MPKSTLYSAGGCYNDRVRPSKIDGVDTPESVLWNSVKTRCYSEKYQSKRPTYIGCEMSENFKNFTFFHDWCREQVGFGSQDFHLDKDLCSKGNKIYSEDTCFFLPRAINMALMLHKEVRGDLPIGVWRLGDSFRSVCSMHGNKVSLGVFRTVEEAFLQYKLAKEEYVRNLAEQFKDQIDPRAYQLLLNYTVEITD